MLEYEIGNMSIYINKTLSQILKWDASRYISGVYFYRLEAGNFSNTKKDGHV